VILVCWNRLEEAFKLLKKVEALCLELGSKEGLVQTYGNQAVILQRWVDALNHLKPSLQNLPASICVFLPESLPVSD
jgi:hypothetical protein